MLENVMPPILAKSLHSSRKGVDVGGLKGFPPTGVVLGVCPCTSGTVALRNQSALLYKEKRILARRNRKKVELDFEGIF